MIWGYPYFRKPPDVESASDEFSDSCQDWHHVFADLEALTEVHRLRATQRDIKNRTKEALEETTPQDL